MKLRKFSLVFSWLIAASLLITGLVEAHAGGKMQVASKDAGPFKLTVWTSPDPARTGQVHVATAVASAEDALPVLDAEVYVELADQNGQGETLDGQATTDNSTNQFLYEHIFDVPNEGLYEVTVTAIGSNLEFGAVSFDLQVEAPPSLALGIVALVIVAIVTGVAVWFYLGSTSPQPALEDEEDEFDTVPG
jgi:hypothetical protein